MILRLASGRLASPGIPRESGDDPDDATWQPLDTIVFPARAGMIPRSRASLPPRSSIPRESGDDPALASLDHVIVRYSPRERG